MTEDTKRQKSLLETVKEMVHDPMLTTAMWTELRAAIAREEAKKDPEGYGAAYWRERAIKAEKELSEVAGQALSFRYRATSAEANLVAVSDRAQQAEADAAWHKAESARLSAELAKKGSTLSAMTQAVGMLSTLHGSMPIDVEDPIGMARKIVEHVEAELAKAKTIADFWVKEREELWDEYRQWQERAEKADAELERLRDDLAKASAGIERQKSLLIFREERCQKAEAELAKAKADTRAKIQNELRSIQSALTSADVLNKFALHSSGAFDAYWCHVHNTIETAISALRDDAATSTYSPPFEGDPKACAFPTQTYTFILERVPTGFMPFAQASVDALSLLLKALGGKS